MLNQRYQHAVGRLWEDEEKIKLWACLSAAYAEKISTHFGHQSSASLTESMRSPNIPLIQSIENETGHDFESFLLSFEDGSVRTRWLHFGLTSSDIIDSVLHLLVSHSTERLLGELKTLLSVLPETITTNAATPMIGRTHGKHASNTRLSCLLGNHLAEFNRVYTQLEAASVSVKIGKLSGPMGDSEFVPKSVEREVLSSFGLTVDDSPTQMICRDRISTVLSCVELLSSAIRRFAVNLRLLCSDDFGAAKITRSNDYVGSSSMPHKNNPTELERLCGLSVEITGLCRICKDTYAESWLQRDIKNSCVERDCLPKIFVLASWSVHSLSEVLCMMSFSAQEMPTDPYRTLCETIVKNDLSRVAAKRLTMERINQTKRQSRYEPTEEVEE
jgi:adenylosuccinate lyase